MKSQSTSTAPGSVTAPRSVVQVPMSDAEPTGLGEVSVSVSMLPAASVVSDEEEEKEEDEESGHADDEEDVDDINHASLPEEVVRVVRANSPTKRPHREDIRKNVRRIVKHDVPDRGMKVECTHVSTCLCVCLYLSPSLPLSLFSCRDNSSRQITLDFVFVGILNAILSGLLLYSRSSAICSWEIPCCPRIISTRVNGCCISESPAVFHNVCSAQ